MTEFFGSNGNGRFSTPGGVAHMAQRLGVESGSAAKVSDIYARRLFAYLDEYATPESQHGAIAQTLHHMRAVNPRPFLPDDAVQATAHRGLIRPHFPMRRPEDSHLAPEWMLPQYSVHNNAVTTTDGMLEIDTPAVEMFKSYMASPLGQMVAVDKAATADRMVNKRDGWLRLERYVADKWRKTVPDSALDTLAEMRDRLLHLENRGALSYGRSLSLQTAIEEIHNPASLERVLTGKSPIRGSNTQKPEEKRAHPAKSETRTYRQGPLTHQFLATTALNGTLHAPQDRQHGSRDPHVRFTSLRTVQPPYNPR